MAYKIPAGLFDGDFFPTLLKTKGDSIRYAFVKQYFTHLPENPDKEAEYEYWCWKNVIKETKARLSKLDPPAENSEEQLATAKRIFFEETQKEVSENHGKSFKERFYSFFFRRPKPQDPVAVAMSFLFYFSLVAIVFLAITVNPVVLLPGGLVVAAVLITDGVLFYMEEKAFAKAEAIYEHNQQEFNQYEKSQTHGASGPQQVLYARPEFAAPEAPEVESKEEIDIQPKTVMEPQDSEDRPTQDFGNKSP